MDPITVGIAAIAALILNACGGDDEPNSKTKDMDAGPPDGSAATGNDGGAGTGGNTSAAGSGGAAGTSGSGGTGGAAGITDGGDMDASSYVDASTPDAMNEVSVAYHFGMIYGTSPKEGVRGSGLLYFSNLDSCQLLGGSFDAESQSGDTIGMSVDLSAAPSINFCDPEVTLPLAGGLFDGVSWMLTNVSTTPTSKQSYAITACSSANDGGAVENCSGALELTIP